MTAALAVILAQALDLLTYGPALARNPYGESNPAIAATSLQNALIAKLVGIAALVLIVTVLGVCSRIHGNRALYVRGAAFAVVVGLVGAGTNVWGWL